MHTQIVTVPVFLNKQSRTLLLPRSFEERIELAAELRFFSTFEEYVEHVHSCDYRLHYHNGLIVSLIEYDEETDTVMGEATPIHERLTARMMFLLGKIFDFRTEGTQYALYASNIKIHIPNGNQSYKPDMAIAIEPAQYIEHRLKKQTITSLLNPHIIVEVLSKGTEKFDKEEKLPNYKSIETVQQIIYVDSMKISILTYIRISDTEWHTVTLNKIEDALPIVGENSILVKDVYAHFSEFQKIRQ